MYYYEKCKVTHEIPYRNLVIMQKDKLHAVMNGSKVEKVSGKELIARKRRK